MERFEVGGVSLAGSKNAAINFKSSFGITLFFGEPPSDASQRAKYRELGPGGSLSVGGYCYVKRAATQEVSRRFQSPIFDQVFQVVETHGDGPDAKAYTLCDLSGSRENLGFT